ERVFVVGHRCEEIRKEREAKAEADYESRHRTMVIRDAQALVMEGAVGNTFAEIEKFIDDETDLYRKPYARLVDLSKFGPKKLTRKQICEQVAAELSAAGWAKITWSRVDKCWKEYSAAMREVWLNAKRESE